MKSKIAIVALLCGSCFADTVAVLPGWTLLGATQNINPSYFENNQAIKSVWKYDTNIQQWRAYSPSPINALPLETIPKGHGFWVNSSQSWIYTTDENQTTANGDIDAINDAIAMDGSILTQAQKADLVFMIQEEKVARDVYEALYAKWGLKIFSNIAQSEQTHINAIKVLMEKYQITCETNLEERGNFTDKQLQSLYDSLVIQGGVSPEEGIKVGVLIEETDIADLQQRIVGAPQDILSVYNLLLDGSYNHLGAFNKNLN